MVDEHPDWMELDEVVDLVEKTLKCYRQRAIDLVKEAADRLQIKSRTVQGPPRLKGAYLGGKEILYSDYGKRIELGREDVLRWLGEFQGESAQRKNAERTSNRLRKRAKRREEGICSACRTIWPTGIPPHLKVGERNRRIRDWLKESGEKQVPEDISQQVRRALKAHPELLHGHATQGQISKPESRT